MKERQIRYGVNVSKKRVQGNSSRGLTTGDLRQPRRRQRRLWGLSLSHTHIYGVFTRIQGHKPRLHRLSIVSSPKPVHFKPRRSIVSAIRHIGLSERRKTLYNCIAKHCVVYNWKYRNKTISMT